MSDELRAAIEKAIQDLSRTLGRAEIEMVRRDLRAVLAAATEGVTGKPSEAGQWNAEKQSRVIQSHISLSESDTALVRGYLERAYATATSSLSARVAELADALRSVNDLQHRMAIELQNIPQEPRIEYWTRKMEDVICTALESTIGTTPYSSPSARVAEHFEAIKNLHVYADDLISREAVIALLESAIGTPAAPERGSK